ncbi:MAG: TAXI family TRAP transporter solute-binding subunit [Rhodospirillales bacterium]|nr:TAXI family TRAP transporter solute-binding subunit [Rhodospirillales bacterium]
MFIKTAVLSAGAAVMMVGTAHAQAVGVGTGPQASLTNKIGSAIAKVMADGAGLNTRAVPHTANSAHAPLVERGTLAFGVSSSGDIVDAFAGKGAFAGHPISKNWVIASRMAALPVGTLVRKDSPYHKLTDMKGKKFACGFTAQKTVLAILNAYLGNAGMKTSDLNCVNVPNTTGGTAQFLKGNVEGTPSSLGGSRLRSAAAKVNGIRILKMNNTPKGVAAMQAAYPGSYLTKLSPKVIGVEGETWTMAFDMILMTSTKTSADTVYKAVKAIHGGKAGLIKVWGGFRGFKQAKMAVKMDGVGIHPGALKFYNEAGIKVAP